MAKDVLVAKVSFSPPMLATYAFRGEIQKSIPFVVH
jgi:hypothetical protein